MNIVDQATLTQLQNIQTKTGKTLDELSTAIQSTALAKHGEIRDMLKRDFALGHGDANTLTHYFLGHAGVAHAAGAAEAPVAEEAVDGIYVGPKAALRPIHDAIMAKLAGLGEYEIAPKKSYLSLRRKKQFAIVGPATNTRIEVGLNMKGVPATDRLVEEKPGGMCQYKVKITDASEVDEELLAWVQTAYDGAG